MYNTQVNFTWDEAKRLANIAKHGLDFADETIRIISMRRADGNETDIYYQNVGYF
jgi:uncharacterized DUF497 family protein